jgi:AraC-like DNA-binding protein
VPIAYSRLMARQLGLQEKDLGLLLRHTGLAGTALLDETTLLTREQQYQIVRNALDLSGDAAFGLRLGQALTPPTHGQLGFLAHTSPTLMTAIEAFRKYLPARVNFTRLRVQGGVRDLACHFEVDASADPAVRRCILEAFSLSLLSLLEHVLGRPLVEGSLHFDYPAPDYAADYAHYVACPVRFDAGECVLRAPRTLLATANISSDHVSHGFALRQCEALLGALAGSADVTSREVKRILLSHPAARISEREVAAALFVSRRTLARRLGREGQGFRQLRDEVLSSMAAAYLRDTPLSVEAIASLLDYHDSANFRRAFKRWFRCTPEVFRRPA